MPLTASLGQAETRRTPLVAFSLPGKSGESSGTQPVELRQPAGRPAKLLYKMVGEAYTAVAMEMKQQAALTTTVTYAYDPLGRLTAADYSDGKYFHYSYDARGNRLAQTTPGGAANYVYDDANRLQSVNGILYTWDANGNLLWDGVYSYTYSSANRLVAVSNQQSAFGFEYNGQGDRVAQTVNNVTTHYTLDLNSGLTQVLADGEHTYLYGAGRIAQHRAAGVDYFLGDALGSVRQLADGNGEVALAKSYQPFGETLSSAGDGESAFAFTGEAVDSTGLVYLRARYYAPTQGRFLTRDTWEGNYNQPLSLNKWLYVSANPVNFFDPTGMWRWQLAEPVFHTSIEDHYEGMGGSNPDRQLEYRIPPARRHPDMFNSSKGDVYEIEPVLSASELND